MKVIDSADLFITWPRPKRPGAESSIWHSFFILLVVLQIGTLEALIGRFRSCVSSKFMEFAELTNGGLYDC